MAKLQKTILIIMLYFSISIFMVFFGTAIFMFALYDWAAQQFGQLAAGFTLAAAAFMMPLIAIILSRWHLKSTSQKQTISSKKSKDPNSQIRAQTEECVKNYPFISVLLAFFTGWIFDSNAEFRNDIVKYAAIYQDLMKESES